MKHRTAPVRARVLGVTAVALVVAGVTGCLAHGPAAGSAAAEAPAATTSASRSEGGSAGGAVAATASSAATVVVEPDDPADVATDGEPSPDTGVTTVPVVTFAEWDRGTGLIEVNGYVAGVVEDGGTCTATLGSGASPVTAEAVGSADASTTVCGLIVLDVGAVAPGTWPLVLSYVSSSQPAASVSDVVTVEVAA